MGRRGIEGGYGETRCQKVVVARHWIAEDGCS
jgi:hypothetical protein